MRVANGHTEGSEAILPALQNSFFRQCLADASDCPERLKSLAMLHLHECCDWTMDEIGQLFGKNRSTICRNLQRTRVSLRAEHEIQTRIDIERMRESRR